MAQYLQLTAVPSQVQVWVNADNIHMFTPVGQQTIVDFDNGGSLTVTQTPQEIVALAAAVTPQL